jgi:hypothetical protein
MYRNDRHCSCRSCQAARLNHPPRRRGAVTFPKPFPLELSFAAIGLLGLLAWAWIVARHL